MGRQTIPPPSTCTAEGCDRPHCARGLCNMRYSRARLRGELRAIKDIPDDERFDSRWQLDPDTGCHVWQRGKDSSGYGQFSPIGGGSQRAHIYAWTRANGPVAKGLVLDHFVCDNKSCCNPGHLRAVPPLANLMRKRGAQVFDARAMAHTLGEGCVNGHPWSPENTYIRPDNGTRMCRECGRARKRTDEYRASRRVGFSRGQSA